MSMVGDSTRSGTVTRPIYLGPLASEEMKEHLTQSRSDHSDTEEDAADTRCGWGACRPSYMQVLARPVTYLVCISALVLTQSLLVAGYTNSILTSIEKRYHLLSSELGVIVSSYDVTCMISIIVVSYLGDRHNRPMWLGRGAVIMAFGSLLFTLPYFLGGKYDIHRYFHNRTEYDINLCNSTNLDASTCSEKNVLSGHWIFILFMIAKMTIGVGTAPVYTLGPTYLYDNVRSGLYSIYAGTKNNLIDLLQRS